ncbi:hypothetical protein TRVA0_033S01464 [Trichomonascus vanleenenianus]|uniref:uncharacterized protein n=1 Tax=Trichomonascus vanleenenianus TaxID=2268995 RepID=UPI003ECB096F
MFKVIRSSIPRVRAFSTINLSKKELGFGHLAILEFNRPEAKNAMSRQLVNELNEYVMKLITKHPDTDRTRALLITSSSADVFCAGADLKERKTFTDHDTKKFLHTLNGTLDLIESLRIPTISVLQGSAFGGGLELALSTDFRVMSEKAVVGLTESRLAIIPGAGGTHRLPKLIGHSRALDMILTGRRVGAQEALTFGLVNRVGADANQLAVEFAEQICGGGPLAIEAGKEAVKGGTHDWVDVGYRAVVNSKDKFEALDAFAAKRKPVFKGE